MMEKIIIKFAKTEALREKAYKFFCSRIYDSHGNIPSLFGLDMEILVALYGGEVIGTIGLIFKETMEELPCCKLFSFTADFPQEGNVCFISKWSATENRAGLILSYVSAKYIASKNILLGVCILKTKVADYLNSVSDNAWSVIAGSKIVKENIPNEDSAYFTSEPIPELYTANISHYVDALNINTVLDKIMSDVVVDLN